MGFFVCGRMGRFGLPKEFIMKRLLLIVLPLLLIVGCGNLNNDVKTDFYSNGEKKYEYHFSNGIQNGPWNMWYENGQKRIVGFFKDGFHDSLWVYYHSNGEKSVQLNYKKSKSNGLYTQWYENGDKSFEGTFKDGKLISKKQWNEDGSVKE